VQRINQLRYRQPQMSQQVVHIVTIVLQTVQIKTNITFPKIFSISEKLNLLI
jgi:DNA-binding TFAR19-related protein (PDSD5 family)